MVLQCTAASRHLLAALSANHPLNTQRTNGQTASLSVCEVLSSDLSCRVQNTAADWIEANLGQGAVVKEKFMSSSNWSSAVRHAAAAAAAAAVLCYIARCKLLKL
jgi:hypothetical protein